MLRYAEEGKVKNQGENHIHIDLPRLQGTNLREKYLTIDCTESENCAPLTKKWLPDMEEIVQKRKVRINNLIFLKESGSEGAAGSYLDCVSYSTSRQNLCVSITINLFFIAHGNYYPSLIPRLDRDAETMTATLVANTFTWLDD